MLPESRFNAAIYFNFVVAVFQVASKRTTGYLKMKFPKEAEFLRG